MERDIVKFASSVARYIAGLPPHLGKKFYFEKFGCGKELLSELWKYRKEGVCPFCKKRKRVVGGFVSHIVQVHYYEIKLMYERCLENKRGK